MKLSFEPALLTGHLIIQCDQMARSSTQYLAIYNNEHLPKSIKIGQSWLKFFPNSKLTLQKLSKTFIFCQSGKISTNLVTLSTTLCLDNCYTARQSRTNAIRALVASETSLKEKGRVVASMRPLFQLFATPCFRFFTHSFTTSVTN